MVLLNTIHDVCLGEVCIFIYFIWPCLRAQNYKTLLPDLCPAWLYLFPCYSYYFLLSHAIHPGIIY